MDMDLMDMDLMDMYLMDTHEFWLGEGHGQTEEDDQAGIHRYLYS